MKKQKKPMIPQKPDPRKEKRVLGPTERRRAYMLIVNSVIFLFVYFGTMETKIDIIPAGVLAPYPITLGQVVYIAYWLAFAVFLITYIIYNRGFRTKGITADMLPDHWTVEQKEEYIADGKKRLEESSWMLSVMIPLLVTIAADAIYLFTWPMVQNLFNIS